jgi:hypothetical protein
VSVIDKNTEEVVSDFKALQSMSDDMVTLDMPKMVLIASDMKLTVQDINGATIRPVNEAYMNRAGEMYILSKRDLITFIHMKHSGLYSLLVNNLVMLKDV